MLLKSDTRINTQTQLHAHMRRRLCIPKGGDLGLLASRQESATSPPPSDSLKHSRWWGQAGESSLGWLLGLQGAAHQAPKPLLSQIHASWGFLCCELACVQLCMLAQDCLARVQSLPSRALGYVGADRGGVKGPTETSSPPPHGALASGRGEGPPLSLCLHGRVGPWF